MCQRSAFLICVFIFCSGQHLFAQKLIALHHAGTASFYTTLQSAYDAAANGDTIYIPGGNFDGITLQKSLTLIGVGHHPDSTTATGLTLLTYLYIYAGSDNSMITGLRINSGIYTDGNISNLTLARCFINGWIQFGNGTRSNWSIYENWIGSNYYYSTQYSLYHYGGSQTNFYLSNNVFQNRVTGMVSSEISNNIFINEGCSAYNSVIRNNIFSANYENWTSNCQWLNNLNSGVNGISGQNTGSDNYLDNAPLTSVFVNYNSSNTFYQNDFHVVNTSYLGNDGAPVGIYGGPFPWKEGSLPFTPHIRAKTINSTTNPDGTLHINITVKAQGN